MKGQNHLLIKEVGWGSMDEALLSYLGLYGKKSVAARATKPHEETIKKRPSQPNLS